ncbi:MAG: hypothetical protein R6T90_02715 [Dissulfuribacterales bacterium]
MTELFHDRKTSYFSLSRARRCHRVEVTVNDSDLERLMAGTTRCQWYEPRVVHFNYGDINPSSKSGIYYVHAVRSAQ